MIHGEKWRYFWLALAIAVSVLVSAAQFVPVPKLITSTTPVGFMWDRSPGAENYRLQYTTNTLNWPTNQEMVALGTNFVRGGQFLFNTKYYIHVRSEAPGVLPSLWSTNLTFTLTNYYVPTIVVFSIESTPIPIKTNAVWTQEAYITKTNPAGAKAFRLKVYDQ